MDVCPVHAPKGNETPGGPAPTKLNEQTYELLRFGFLESGTQHGAAKAAGIHRVTLSEWMKQGRADKAEGKRTDLVRVLETIDQAKSDLIAELGAQVMANAIRDQDNHTLLKLLRILSPDEYADPVQHHRHAGVKDAPPIATTAPPTQVLNITLGTDVSADIAATLEG